MWILEEKLLSWKALLSYSQCSIHTASGSYLPMAYSPEVVPSNGCPPRAMSHVAPHTAIPWNTQGFLATFLSLCKMSPSYCESAAKSLWLQRYWKLRREKLLLVFWYPEHWSMRMGILRASKKYRGSSTAPSVVSTSSLNCKTHYRLVEQYQRLFEGLICLPRCPSYQLSLKWTEVIFVLI